MNNLIIVCIACLVVYLILFGIYAYSLYRLYTVKGPTGPQGPVGSPSSGGSIGVIGPSGPSGGRGPTGTPGKFSYLTNTLGFAYNKQTITIPGVSEYFTYTFINQAVGTQVSINIILKIDNIQKGAFLYVISGPYLTINVYVKSQSSSSIIIQNGSSICLIGNKSISNPQLGDFDIIYYYAQIRA